MNSGVIVKRPNVSAVPLAAVINLVACKNKNNTPTVVTFGWWFRGRVSQSTSGLSFSPSFSPYYLLRT